MNVLMFVVILVSSLAALTAGCGSLAANGPGQSRELPLIDKEIPANLETATFALG
jgi:hypothetical protein